MYTRGGKNRIRRLKILRSISEFCELWKYQNNPACTEHVKSLQDQNVEGGHYTVSKRPQKPQGLLGTGRRWEEGMEVRKREII